MKTGLFLVCSLVVFGGAVGAADFPGTNRFIVSPQLVEALAEQARTNHPWLRAADLRADAALWGAAAVRRWEDPMARVGVMGAERMRREDDGDLIYGVEQKLPLFGKPQAARAFAQAGAQRLREEAGYRAAQLQRDVHQQLLKVAFAERALALSREDVAALDTIVASTEEKYRNGFATQVELLQSQNERARRANLLRTDEALLQVERATLNRLLNRATSAEWPQFLLPAELAPLPAMAEMIDHATVSALQLQLVRASVREAQSALEVARRRGRPDVAVGLDGRQFADSGEFREGMFSVAFSIPWGNRRRYAADIRREQHNLEAAEQEVAGVQLELRDEITRLSLRIENARRESTLYRTDIIPRTEQALSAAHAAWLNDRGTLRDLLEVRRMLVEARLAEARALAEQHAMLADLVLHCGLGELHQTFRDAARPARTKNEETR
jgi:cobalt-zinc-cadmium efflux system outer membrane protein